MGFPDQDLTHQFNDAMDNPISKNAFPLFPLRRTQLTTRLSEHKLTFGIIGIGESQLKLNKINLISIQIPGYNVEFNPNECNNEGTVIYNKKD